MAAFFSCCTSTLATLSRAAARSLSARLRGGGLGSVHPQWRERAIACESCHLRFLRAGISYCGRPLLDRIERDPAIHGCGCPTRDKARDPKEHCPLTLASRPAGGPPDCDCKWCWIV